jgi:hypothetical protein
MDYDQPSEYHVQSPGKAELDITDGEHFESVGTGRGWLPAALGARARDRALGGRRPRLPFVGCLDPGRRRESWDASATGASLSAGRESTTNRACGQTNYQKQSGCSWGN